MALIVGLAIGLTVLVYISAQPAFAQSTTATIVGQVTVNGNTTNGVLVTCGQASNTTFTYQGQPGFYFISGLPYGTSLPFKATYQGYSYTDTVDPLPTGQQYYQLPTVGITTSTGTVTPTPLPNATATPAPNATITPTPAPNATATPAPNATVTPAPNATVTPGPMSATPTPVPPQPTMPPATPMPPGVTATPLPALATPTAKPTIAPTPVPTLKPTPTAAPSPTQTRSPGFEVLLVLSALLAAAYIVLKKGR